MRGARQRFTRSRHLIGSTQIRGVVAVLFTVAILVNIFQFDVVKGRYRALRTHSTPDITKIVQAYGSKNLKARYGLFFELGRRYPGSTIILPRYKTLGTEFEASLLSYGRAAHVVVTRDEAKALLSGLEYEPFIVAQGKGSERGHPFAIAAGSNPKVFLVLLRQGKTILLDLSLLLKARST